MFNMLKRFAKTRFSVNRKTDLTGNFQRPVNRKRKKRTVVKSFESGEPV